MEHILKIASIAEHSSTHGIWIGEDITSQRYEIFSLTSIVMCNAPGKTIGIGVTSPLIRNITTIARAAAALWQKAPGRFRLGLGVGGLQDLARIGTTVEKPVAMLRDASETLRNIWRGWTLNQKGETFELKSHAAMYKLTESIPIHFGVRGPKLLRLASRIADGVILSGPLPYIEKAVSIIKIAARDRNLERNFKITVWLPTLIVNKRTNKQFAKVVAATVIADTTAEVLDLAGISERGVEQIQSTARRRGYKEAAKYVTEELLDSFAISGNPGQVCDVFHSMHKLGANEVVFGPPYGYPILEAIDEVVKMWTGV
jgi:5,10-methylenetetrahydromethanopterin reductase